MLTEIDYSHPGGKLAELGADQLSDEEILAILIGTGTNGHSAEEIAKEILSDYGSLPGMYGVPLQSFLKYKGLGDVKITRVAAAFELARRVAHYVDRNPQLDLL
jgi:DNA repair protein RadC